MVNKIILRFILILIFAMSLSCKKTNLLNYTETNYLKENDSIKVALFTYYPLYQFKNEKGEIDGIFIDYLNLIEKKTNYKFQKVYYDNWSTLIKDAKANKFDVILEIQETKLRKNYLTFYEPLFESNQVIIQRHGAKKIKDLDHFGNNTLVLPSKYSIAEIINTNYPNIKVAYEKDDIECLRKVNSGEYDAYIGPKAIINYLISNKELKQLYTTTDLEYTYNPGIAVIKKNIIVSNIFEKALNSITKEEKKVILDNWLFYQVVPFYEKPYFLFWCCTALVGLSFLIFLFNRYLKLRVKQKIAELLIEKQKVEEKSQLKSLFIKNISHEIRTPINGIIGYSQLLHNKNLSLEEQKEYTSNITENCNELMHTIDNLLEISSSKINNVIFNNISLNLDTFFKEVENKFSQKSKNKNNSLHFKNLGTKNLLYIDKQKISKIIHNLVDNAIKFTDNGKIDITYQIENNTLKIIISDTGIGIETQETETIFNYFSQTEKEISKNLGGLGLGLAIAKKNADLLGFELKIESELGIGTTFIITKTNITEEKNIEVKENQSKNSFSDERKVILIAEDGDVNFLILKKLINKLFNNRFEIIRAINGEAAVYYCEILTNKIDLVLMDIKMPIMDGYEATKKIKELRPNLPIIVQTAFSSENDISQAKKSGCDDFIEKPIDQNILGKVISKYLK